MKTPRARARRIVATAVVLGALAALAVLAGVGFAASSSSSSAAYQYQYGHNKVTICHHTHSTKHPFVTITVAQASLKAHLPPHGHDTVGPCPATSPTSPSKIKHGKSGTHGNSTATTKHGNSGTPGNSGTSGQGNNGKGKGH